MPPTTRWLMVTELFQQGAVSIPSCCGGTTQLSVLIYWAWCTWPRQSSQTSPKSAISGSEKNWTADGKRLVLLCTCRQPSLLSVSDSLCCSRHHGLALHTPSPTQLAASASWLPSGDPGARIQSQDIRALAEQVPRLLSPFHSCRQPRLIIICLPAIRLHFHYPAIHALWV